MFNDATISAVNVKGLEHSVQVYFRIKDRGTETMVCAVEYACLDSLDRFVHLTGDFGGGGGGAQVVW